MRSAIEIANWMIANGGKYDLTHLKVQKLLYIAFGCHAAKHNEFMFYDPIEAWQYGPVVQSVYQDLKWTGSDIIKRPITLEWGGVETPILGDDRQKEVETLQNVFTHFGSFTASQLVRWSHEIDGPWDETYDDGRGRLKEICKQKIRRHFIKRLGAILPRARLSIKIG
jgi:uncharacterized phage-associated protein